MRFRALRRRLGRIIAATISLSPGLMRGCCLGYDPNRTYSVPLDRGDAGPLSDDAGALEECRALCRGDHDVQSCTIDEANREVTCHAVVGCVAGRRPGGLRAARRRRGAGGWLAEMARLERASVTAFARLARELDTAGAPRRLVRAARSARADEVRHARVMAALARRRGAEPAAARVRPARPRPLWRLARENAVEGCVRETYGALVALWQARTAVDPDIRAALGAIAEDEARHATLAWQIAAWVTPRLSERERRRVARAQDAAWSRLAASAARASADRHLGLPGPAEARRLLDGLRSLHV